MKKITLKDKHILFGISGSIAAYKSCEIIRGLVTAGARVYVLATKNALNFVTPLTLRTLSGNPVIQDIFDEAEFSNIMHIQIAHWADLIVVAPATANIIGKVANGIADDVVSTTILATKASVIFAPAMNDQMYENPIYQENEKKLKRHGYHFVHPEYGELACGYEGIGRLAEADQILTRISHQLSL